MLDSNLQNSPINQNWDVIFPITTLTENYFQSKTLYGYFSTSIFLKYGPRLARNLFTFLNLFTLLKQFPLLWLKKKIKFAMSVDLLFLLVWFMGFLNNFLKFLFSDIVIFFILSVIFFPHLIFSKFNRYFLNLTKDFWISTISFITNSKYVNLAQHFGI